jgi:hypothetical protein
MHVILLSKPQDKSKQLCLETHIWMWQHSRPFLAFSATCKDASKVVRREWSLLSLMGLHLMPYSLAGPHHCKDLYEH